MANDPVYLDVLGKVRGYEDALIRSIPDVEMKAYSRERMKDLEKWRKRAIDDLQSTIQGLTEQLATMENEFSKRVESRVKEEVEPWQKNMLEAEQEFKQRKEEFEKQEKDLTKLATQLGEQKSELEEFSSRLDAREKGVSAKEGEAEAKRLESAK